MGVITRKIIQDKIIKLQEKKEVSKELEILLKMDELWAHNVELLVENTHLKEKLAGVNISK